MITSLLLLVGVAWATHGFVTFGPVQAIAPGGTNTACAVFHAGANVSLAIASQTAPTMSFVSRNQTGAWNRTSFFNATEAGRAVVVGDVTGDEHDDVYFGNLFTAGSIVHRVYNTLPSGAMSTSPLWTASDFTLSAVAAQMHDLNFDGRKDLITLMNSGALAYWLNVNGTFLARTSLATAFAGSLAVGNVTGDIFPDIVVADSGSNLRLYQGGAGLAFAIQGFSTPTGSRSIHITDLAGGDGFGEVLIGSALNRLVLWRWMSGGLVGPTHVWTFASSNNVVTGDCDGDGDRDVFVSSESDNTYRYLENVSNATHVLFAPPVVIFNNASVLYLPTAMAASDATGDGVPDLFLIARGNGSAGVAMVQAGRSCPVPMVDATRELNASLSVSPMGAPLHVPWGTVANYTCKPGFVNFGANTTTCLSHGAWASGVANCLAVCPPLTVPLMGNLSASGPARELDLRVLTCSLPALREGPDTAVCLSSGVWSVIGACVFPPPPPSPPLSAPPPAPQASAPDVVGRSAASSSGSLSLYVLIALAIVMLAVSARVRRANLAKYKANREIWRPIPLNVALLLGNSLGAFTLCSGSWAHGYMSRVVCALLHHGTGLVMAALMTVVKPNAYSVSRVEFSVERAADGLLAATISLSLSITLGLPFIKKGLQSADGRVRGLATGAGGLVIVVLAALSTALIVLPGVLSSRYPDCPVRAVLAVFGYSAVISVLVLEPVMVLVRRWLFAETAAKVRTAHDANVTVQPDESDGTEFLVDTVKRDEQDKPVIGREP